MFSNSLFLIILFLSLSSIKIPYFLASMIASLKTLYFFIISLKSVFIISICFSKFNNKININNNIEIFHIKIE